MEHCMEPLRCSVALLTQLFRKKERNKAIKSHTFNYRRKKMSTDAPQGNCKTKEEKRKKNNNCLICIADVHVKQQLCLGPHNV